MPRRREAPFNINKGATPEPFTKVGEDALPSFRVGSEEVMPEQRIVDKRVAEDYGEVRIYRITCDPPWRGYEYLWDVEVTQDGRVVYAAEFLDLTEARAFVHERGPVHVSTIVEGYERRETRLGLGVP
jgi:hypothetical protein